MTFAEEALDYLSIAAPPGVTRISVGPRGVWWSVTVYPPNASVFLYFEYGSDNSVFAQVCPRMGIKGNSGTEQWLTTIGGVQRLLVTYLATL